MGDKAPFNAVHPPFATSVDELPPASTEAHIVGTALIGKDNFDYVVDPAYPWQNMPDVTPSERQQRDQVKTAKLNEVEAYILQRTNYWERVARLQFAEDVEYQVMVTVGFETSHQESETETTTETIGVTLGVELSGDLFAPSKAAQVAALRKALGTLEGGKASSSAEFTYELAHELSFTRTDSMTYREERQVTTITTYRGGAVYFVWSLQEELNLSRKRPHIAASEPISNIVAGTETTWTDRLVYREDNQTPLSIGSDPAGTGARP